jgi:hypothetical protein
LRPNAGGFSGVSSWPCFFFLVPLPGCPGWGKPAEDKEEGLFVTIAILIVLQLWVV